MSAHCLVQQLLAIEEDLAYDSIAKEEQSTNHCTVHIRRHVREKPSFGPYFTWISQDAIGKRHGRSPIQLAARLWDGKYIIPPCSWRHRSTLATKFFIMNGIQKSRRLRDYNSPANAPLEIIYNFP